MAISWKMAHPFFLRHACTLFQFHLITLYIRIHLKIGHTNNSEISAITVVHLSDETMKTLQQEYLIEIEMLQCCNIVIL